MKLSHSEYVAAVRRNGAGLLSAASLGLDAPTPCCPDWTVEQLVRHVGKVYAWVNLIVTTRATSKPPERPKLGEGDPLALTGDQLDELVQHLAGDPEMPVWNWSGQPDDLAFWARRMAHESAIHRYDAQDAHGVAQPIDEDLAADGIDELIDVIIPVGFTSDAVTTPGAIRLVSSEDGEWRLGISADGVERLDRSPEDATVVTGTSSDLLLAATGRIRWDSLDVGGDPGVLETWTAALDF